MTEGKLQTLLLWQQATSSRGDGNEMMIHGICFGERVASRYYQSKAATSKGATGASRFRGRQARGCAATKAIDLKIGGRYNLKKILPTMGVLSVQYFGGRRAIL